MFVAESHDPPPMNRLAPRQPHDAVLAKTERANKVEPKV